MYLHQVPQLSVDFQKELKLLSTCHWFQKHVHLPPITEISPVLRHHSHGDCLMEEIGVCVCVGGEKAGVGEKGRRREGGGGGSDMKLFIM